MEVIQSEMEAKDVDAVANPGFSRKGAMEQTRDIIFLLSNSFKNKCIIIPLILISFIVEYETLVP